MELLSRKKLRNAMLAKGLGVNELSRQTKINPASLSQLLKKDSQIRLPTLAKLINALGVRADDLIEEV